MYTYEILRYPALILFASAFVFETIVTGRLFGPTGTVKGFMKYWAIFSLGMMSAVNIYAFFEVRGAEVLTQAVLTKILYSATGAQLVLFALIFHKPKWVKHRPYVGAHNERSDIQGSNKLEGKN